MKDLEQMTLMLSAVTAKQKLNKLRAAEMAKPQRVPTSRLEKFITDFWASADAAVIKFHRQYPD